MKCPHCLENFHDDPEEVIVNEIEELEEEGEKYTIGYWVVESRFCPACNGFIAYLISKDEDEEPIERFLVYPKGSSRPPCPPEVPKNIGEDYTEACLVLPDSPKASAALSRRCLQNILRETAKVKPANLFDEIQEVLDNKSIPTHIAESIDAVRNIGNFAAHPNKSTSTGEIFPVEPEEAEWNLDVLEALFDYYYVLPAKTQKKRAALNKKLQEAGKKPMK